MLCLNVVGCKILELIEKGFDETQIADHVSRAYVMDIRTVRAHVHEFIEVLNKHGVLLIRSAVESS
jgi:DNA-binding NarL/FixJ family response regulator